MGLQRCLSPIINVQNRQQNHVNRFSGHNALDDCRNECSIHMMMSLEVLDVFVADRVFRVYIQMRNVTDLNQLWESFFMFSAYDLAIWRPILDKFFIGILHLLATLSIPALMFQVFFMP